MGCREFTKIDCAFGKQICEYHTSIAPNAPHHFHAAPSFGSCNDRINTAQQHPAATSLVCVVEPPRFFETLGHIQAKAINIHIANCARTSVRKQSDTHFKHIVESVKEERVRVVVRAR